MSWYLIKIETSKGKIIDFDYESNITHYFNKEYDKLKAMTT
jgi:hypothetical protein